MRILSIKGSVSLPDIDESGVEAAQQMILADLRKQAVKGELSGATVSFKNWYFLQLPARRYAWVDKGCFTIHNTKGNCRIDYELSLKKLTISLASALSMAVIYFIVAGVFGFVIQMVFYLIIFFFLGVCNYLSISRRSRAYLDNVAKRLSESY